MKIFNKKKLQEEWRKKVEESYNQGKKDAENGFNNLLSAVTKDKEYWNSLSEKELLVEMMFALKLNNNNVDGLNSKIEYIQNYKEIFKELNNNMDEIKKAEDLLKENIENERKQIVEFEKQIKNVTSKINEIDSTLKEIIEIKEDINKVIADINTALPRLKETSEQIDKIAQETNNVIETYSDSPAETLRELKDKVDDLYDEFQNDDDDDDDDDENIKAKLNFICSKLDALDQFGYDSLYSRIEEVKKEIENLNNGYSMPVQYGYDDVCSRIQDLENKIDYMNIDK